MRRDLRIGIVTSDPDGWHSRQLLQAAGRVALAQTLNPLDVSVRVDGEGAGVWLADEPASAYDALILRGLNNDGLPDFQLESYRLLENQVPVVVNRVGPILAALDKCRTSYLLRRAGVPTPPTLVTQRLEEAEDAVAAFGVAVLKPLYGSLGEDIVRVQVGQEARATLSHMLTTFGAIYVQRFEPPGGRDIRAFVVGDRVVAAVYRVAQQGEWITNVFRGATTEPVDLAPEVAALCIKAARVIGLDYTGVDVIETPDGPTILEVNGTPSWMGVEQAWQRSIAADIVAHVVRKVLARRRAGRGHSTRKAIA